MIEIIFRNIDEAKRFYSYIQDHLFSSLSAENQVLLTEEKALGKVKIRKADEEVLEAARKAFHSFILKIKLHDWFCMILKEQYYYADEEEQRQIVDIIYSILEGHRVDLAAILKDASLSKHLEEAIKDMYDHHKIFSLDSFLKFRMRPFFNRLKKYIEISIDEYKMEQEYQMFIQTLRDFLSSRQAKVRQLHLAMKDEVTFFDDRFVEIKRAQLTGMIDRRLLFNHPVYVDSVTIAPLLSIAPNVIYLYTDDREKPLVRTIRNIFEERVRIRSLNCFFQNKDLTYSRDDVENIIE